MTVEQLLNWQAYAEIERFGTDRDDARFAYIARILGEIHRDREKEKEPFTLNQFIADFLNEMGELEKPKPDPQKNLEQQKKIAIQIASAFNQMYMQQYGGKKRKKRQ